MAVTKFQQTIWSKKIQDDLERKCKLVDDCTREYEGDCKYANTVRILGVGDPTVSGYTGQDITIEEMTDKDQLLPIDVQNYFAFEVKDVDKAQSVPGLPEKYQQKAVHKLAVKRDSFIGKLVAGKAQATVDELDTEAEIPKYKEGATNITTATAKTQAAIKIAIDEAIVALRERDFDDAGVIEIDPRTYNTFKNNLIELSTNNPDLIKRGVVGMYDNYEVKMTNNLYKDTTHIWCIVRSKNAIAFCGQINEVEAGRMEKRFSDYIRGLDTFGSKIIAQPELQAVKIPV